MTEAPLGNWRDGPAKQAILGFVVATVTAGGAGFVPAAERIACFDNDGTLWVEQPLPPQFDFVFRRWAEDVQTEPALAQRQPYKGLIEKDMGFPAGIATQDPEVIGALLEAFVHTWAGTSPEQFDREVRDWVETAKQPRFGVPYVDLVYKPMLELIEFLTANDFRVFVCSGGGRDFMRVFAEETWGIHKENVIGTAAEYTYADGKIVRSKQALGGLDIGPGKPEHIFAQAGRLPLFAAGNADVDIEMLEAAKFSLLIDHDDAEREFSYDKGAERSMARAADLDWTVVSMNRDWGSVFA